MALRCRIARREHSYSTHSNRKPHRTRLGAFMHALNLRASVQRWNPNVKRSRGGVSLGGSPGVPPGAWSLVLNPIRPGLHHLAQGGDVQGTSYPGLTRKSSSTLMKELNPREPPGETLALR